MTALEIDILKDFEFFLARDSLLEMNFRSMLELKKDLEWWENEKRKVTVGFGK